ncbi:MAG: transposase [Yoonia sp.]|nr:transposase [Yoonia sp.]
MLPTSGPNVAPCFVGIEARGTGRKFGSGHEFTAWLGLTLFNCSSGGKGRLG